MNSEGDRAGDREIREKIMNQLRSIGEGPEKPITAKELQNLMRAAGRLDQMLKSAPDADRQALKSAAERLDQLLSDIRAGKSVSQILKRRENTGT